MVSTTLAKLFVEVLFVSHWGACFLYYVGELQCFYEGSCWLNNNQRLYDSDNYSKYISSLYFFIATMTCVGYGDLKPISKNGKLFQILIMMISNGIFAYIIGSVGKIISLNKDIESDFIDKIRNINKLLIEKEVNEELRLKIRKYLEHNLEIRLDQKIDGNEVLSMINKNLREEIILELNGQSIKNFPFFNGYRGCERIGILLTRLLKDETITGNDLVFEKGDISDRLYFILKGKILIYNKRFGIIYKELIEGNYFGDIGFFSREKRCADAASVTFVNLSYLEISDFINIPNYHENRDLIVI